MDKPTHDDPAVGPQKPDKASASIFGLLFFIVILFLMATVFWKLLTLEFHISNPITLAIDILIFLLIASGLWQVFRTFILGR